MRKACDPIGKEWFFVEGDAPRSDALLAEQFLELRRRGVNFLLDVPPDKAGVIPESSVKALLRLAKSASM